MDEWFCSGKIYTRNENEVGHTCCGFFSSTATAEKGTPIKEVFDSFSEVTEKEYGVTSDMVHIEHLYKV